MKIKNIKHYVLGIITGVSIIFVTAFAATMGSGTIGSLFQLNSGSYYLLGSNILDESITSNKIQNNTITSTDIATNTITSSDINIDSVQKRVSGTCDSGYSIRVIKSDGSAICQKDNTGSVIKQTALYQCPSVYSGPCGSTCSTAIGLNSTCSRTVGTSRSCTSHKIYYTCSRIGYLVQ